MKKGIESYTEFDPSGHLVLVIKKQRGKLTMEEIREAAMDYSQNYYALVMKCMDGDMSQYFDDDLKGDAVELYEMDDVLEVMGRLKKL